MRSNAARVLPETPTVDAVLLRLVKGDPHCMRNAPPSDEHNGGVSCPSCGSDNVDETAHRYRGADPLRDGETITAYACGAADCNHKWTTEAPDVR